MALGVSKFIFASTCSNYGKMEDPNAYVDEDSKLAPASLYAELKVKFEKYMLSTIKKIDKMKIDHALGLGSEVSDRRSAPATKILSEHLGQGKSTDAHAYPLKELSAGKIVLVSFERIHLR